MCPTYYSSQYRVPPTRPSVGKVSSLTSLQRWSVARRVSASLAGAACRGAARCQRHRRRSNPHERNNSDRSAAQPRWPSAPPGDANLRKRTDPPALSVSRPPLAYGRRTGRPRFCRFRALRARPSRPLPPEPGAGALVSTNRATQRTLPER